VKFTFESTPKTFKLLLLSGLFLWFYGFDGDFIDFISAARKFREWFRKPGAAFGKFQRLKV
jgi:hypothetical protein